MDFSKLNPWRKTPTLYNFDNNYRPILLSATGPDGADIEIETIIPSDFYAHFVSTVIRQTNTFSLGSSNADFTIFRGSDVVFFASWGNPTQLQDTVTWVIFTTGSHVEGGGVGAFPKHGAPINLVLLPGDRIRVTIQSSKTDPRDPILFMNLNAYYF